MLPQIVKEEAKGEKFGKFHTGKEREEEEEEGLTRVETFGYGCGFSEELAAEWASHACCNRVPSHFHHLI